MGVAASLKTRQGLKLKMSLIISLSILVAASLKTRQGLKPISRGFGDSDLTSCSELENPTGIEADKAKFLQYRYQESQQSWNRLGIETRMRGVGAEREEKGLLDHKTLGIWSYLRQKSAHGLMDL